MERDPLERYKVFRRIALIVVLFLHWRTVELFFINIEHIGASQATVITAILGLLSTVIFFYQSSRSKEDENMVQRTTLVGGKAVRPKKKVQNGNGSKGIPRD